MVSKELIAISLQMFCRPIPFPSRFVIENDSSPECVYMIIDKSVVDPNFTNLYYKARSEPANFKKYPYPEKKIFNLTVRI